jgi:2-oxoisovalerate dehydrogenase E2 component (dihydrolipoyl transacylase)
MAHYVFKLPDVGEGITEATIARWRVAVGDRIEEDQALLDLETDKAIVEIPSPVTGTVVSVHAAQGESIAVGSEVVVIETVLLSQPAAPEDAKTKSAKEATVANATKAENATDPQSARPSTSAASARRSPTGLARQTPRVAASPAVRKRARELGIDLHAIRSGQDEARITHADLDALLSRRGYGAVQRVPGAGTQVDDVIEEHRIAGVRRRIAERMQEAKRRIPHFSYVEEVDVTGLEDLRRYLNERYNGTRPKLTPLPFVMRALVLALVEHPEINARFDDEKGILRRHGAIHIGIATQTPNGLMVPVIANVQSRTLWECAAEISRLATTAREGRATRSELSGSTITITSLGALGGVASTPIINHPEVAILGLNRIAERPVAQDGAIAVRKIMNLSSSFDHRVIDGWNAASFIHDVKRFLEQPSSIFIH